MIKKLLQSLVFAVICCTGLVHAASGFKVFDTMEQCENARDAGKAIAYVPTTKAAFSGGQGWTKKVVPVGGACLGDAYVLEDGLPTKGKVVFVAEGFAYWESSSGGFRMHDCSNHFGLIAFAGKKSEQVVTIPCESASCGATTNIIPVINVTKEIKVCEAFNGKRFDPTDNVCNFEPTKAKISTVVESTVTYAVPVTTYTKSAAKAESCTNCVPQEKVTVNREEKRTDGRCFVQTNMGYRFELRANTQTGRLMAGLIDASTEQLVSGTKALFIGDVMAAKNQKGYDCDGMQAQLYVPENWKAVRTAYNLPSACELTAKTP